MRKKFIGLSKSNNGDWKVHQQYHSPRLPIGIKSRLGKYFMIKEEDDGELFIKYYDKILRIGVEDYEYASVLKEIFPEFNGDEVAADRFIYENQEKLDCFIKDSIFDYCIEHNKELKIFNIIEINSKKLYCDLSDTSDPNVIFNKYCELVKCTVEDLVCAIKEYFQSIESSRSYAQINPTAREHSIVRHYPGE